MRKALMKNFIWITSLLLIGTSQGHCDPYPIDKRPDEVGMSLYGEFIYWYWHLPEKDYAIRQTPTATGNVLNDIFYVNQEWEPGYRLQGEYRFNSGWDLVSRYTFIRLLGTGEIRDPDLLNTLAQGASGITEAQSFLSLHYNLFDFVLARVVQPRESLMLRFSFGARIPWMKQSWKNLYPQSDNTPPNAPVASVRMNWRLLGGGPTAAVEGKWNYWSSMFMMGRASMGLLYTRTKVRLANLFTTPPASNDAFLNERAQKVTPMFDMAFGFGWDSTDFQNIRFTIAAGGEVAYWWNLDEQRRISPNNFIDFMKPGPLSLMGIFVRGGVSY